MNQNFMENIFPYNTAKLTALSIFKITNEVERCFFFVLVFFNSYFFWIFTFRLYSIQSPTSRKKTVLSGEELKEILIEETDSPKNVPRNQIGYQIKFTDFLMHFFLSNLDKISVVIIYFAALKDISVLNFCTILLN